MRARSRLKRMWFSSPSHERSTTAFLVACFHFSNLLGRNQACHSSCVKNRGRLFQSAMHLRLRHLGIPILCILATQLSCFLSPASAQVWQSLGPEGGTVRSLAFDPKEPDRVFLGTSAGRLFLSLDAGASWSRLASLGGA